MARGMSLIVLGIAAIACARIAPAQSQGRDRAEMKPGSKIIFVCEHGAALSVVAAAYFNKIVREEHLSLYAIARGTTPQKDISTRAREGLQADGVAFETRKPLALSASDAKLARRIVAFYPLPAKYSRLAPVEDWQDVTWTPSDYPVVRDAILAHIEKLVRELKAEAKPSAGVTQQ